MGTSLHKKIYLIPAGCIAFILYCTVFGDTGLLRILELRQDKQRIEARLENTKKENEKLRQEIIALSSDHRYLESIARKDLGLFHRNEVIYQFPPEKK
jgi:cell division protein FtsB